MTKKGVLLILAVCMLLGCASYSTNKRMERFRDTTRAYDHELMRANYMVAESYLEGADEDDYQPYKPNENVKIVNMKTARMVVSDEGMKVSRYVNIQYFYKDRNILKSLPQKQKWRYDEDEKRWVLTSGLPVFE